MKSYKKENGQTKQKSPPSKANIKVTKKDDEDPLKKAIFALGGDEEDYALIQGVSDTEHEQSTNDPKLTKDLKKFMKTPKFPSESKEWIVEESDISKDGEESESSEDVSIEMEEPVEEEKPKPVAKQTATGKYLFPPTSQWYTVLPLAAGTPASTPSETTISTLFSRAQSLLTSDVSVYESQNGTTNSSSDAAFLSRVLSSGTLSDRLSALTLMVQSSPLHNQRALDTLKGLATKKGGKGEGVKACRCIVDWWVGGGAPDRKLKYFRDQPLEHEQRTDAHLVVWYFEDWLKKFFFSVLQVLEVLSHDSLPYIRTQAMALIAQLLITKPEQEQNLMSLLVNKLGDSERSIASKASYHLHQLLQAHPNMKAIVVREVSSLVLKAPSSAKPSKGKVSGGKADVSASRSTTNPHARYYAIVTFNQIVLSSKTQADKDVASRLVEVYFELFKDIVGEGHTEDDNDAEDDHSKGDEAESSAMKAKNLIGREQKRKNKEKEKMKLKGKEKQAQQSNALIADGEAESKVISAILTGINRALPFAGMDNAALDKHMDTLFRITHEATFNVSIQALVLIQKVSESRPAMLPRYMRTLYASLLDHRLSVSSKQAMYLNLLFKSLKLDTDIARVKAFVKRFLQSLISGPGYEPSFICGGLFLLGELFGVTPGLRQSISRPPPADAELYDPRKREPEYSGAGKACIWELVPLLQHYHPSVALHARQLLDGVPLTANADLSLNTLSHFLDLFVYKNPKKPKPRGASAMQPAAALGNDAGATVRLVKGMNREESATVNQEDFWRKKVADIPANQLFFHKFFTQKKERNATKMGKVEKRKAGKDDKTGDNDDKEIDKDIEDEDEKEEDSEFEDEVWQAMKRSMPSADDKDIDDDDSLSESGSEIEATEQPGLSEDEDNSSQDGKSGDQSEDSDEAGEVESASENGEGGKGDSDDSEDSEGVLSIGNDDDDDIVDSEAEIPEGLPDGLIHFDSEDEDDGEDAPWGGINSSVAGVKRKAGKQDDNSGRKKKKRLKDLPLFASLEDYEKLIDAQPEDNI